MYNAYLFRVVRVAHSAYNQTPSTAAGSHMSTLFSILEYRFAHGSPSTQMTSLHYFLPIPMAAEATYGQVLCIFNLLLGAATKGRDDLQWSDSGHAYRHKRPRRLETVKLKTGCNDKSVRNKSCCASCRKDNGLVCMCCATCAAAKIHIGAYQMPLQRYIYVSIRIYIYNTSCPCTIAQDSGTRGSSSETAKGVPARGCSN